MILWLNLDPPSVEPGTVFYRIFVSFLDNSHSVDYADSGEIVRATANSNTNSNTNSNNLEKSNNTSNISNNNNDSIKDVVVFPVVTQPDNKDKKSSSNTSTNKQIQQQKNKKPPASTPTPGVPSAASMPTKPTKKTSVVPSVDWWINIQPEGRRQKRKRQSLQSHRPHHYQTRRRKIPDILLG